jgi:hypothetical protein
VEKSSAFTSTYGRGFCRAVLGRLDLAAVYLAGLQLHVVESDLLPMHVETAYNVHSGPPQAPTLTRHGYGLTIRV